MLASGTEILEYLPQRPPVVMIDKLLFAGPDKTISGLLVAEDNIFFDNGFFTESGLVENIAQTAAAGVGFVCNQENRKVPVGFIASIKDLKIHQLPEAGDELTTEVVVTNQVMGVSIIEGKVFNNKVLLAECEMRIFVKPD
jgi:3-hydroxymyristoyl/3-hydroxydecanoyl-(acyl carrier protein) dehydratase